MDKELEVYKNHQQVDEAILKIIDACYERYYAQWTILGCPNDHIINSFNILKTLYEQGGPDKVF